MKIGTYNIRIDNLRDFKNHWWWGGRMFNVGDNILISDVDILCVQEIKNHLQLISLNMMLYEYGVVSYGRESNKGYKGERLGIYYKLEKYRLLLQDFVFLSETPRKCSFGFGANHKRIAMYVKLIDKDTDEIINVICTHLDFDENIQINELKTIFDNFNINFNETLFLCGDLNMTPDTLSYEYIKTLLYDSYLVAEENKINNGTFFNWENGKDVQVPRIDYIFTNNEVEKYDMITKQYKGFNASDHAMIHIKTK